jgi:hypothetical protein
LSGRSLRRLSRKGPRSSHRGLVGIAQPRRVAGTAGVDVKVIAAEACQAMRSGRRRPASAVRSRSYARPLR